MPRNQPYILLRLRKRRHPSITLHHIRPRIISRQRQPQIPAIPRQQILQIMRPRINILRRIEYIRDRIKGRSSRQKLHQPLRPPPRNRPRIKIRLRRDHLPDQSLIHPMLLRRRMNQFPKRPRRNQRHHRYRREMFLRLDSQQIIRRHRYRPAIHRQTHPLPIPLVTGNMQPRPRTQHRIIRPRCSRQKPGSAEQRYNEADRRK